ncbi:MAG TPA: formate dehydrogenase accessory sulfurtransferase FdhD [Steroidobacteraceae bacterium]|jgi:FdhD protein|nr:formate dehydrogenase accessory sulfurtransferase FdhD [Steroidobacteraceae bacterium]
MKSPVQELWIDALRDAGHARRSDVLAVEEPLEIRLMRDGLPEADENGGTGRSISVTMRTPGNDAELALGFLHGEGLLREPRDVIDTGYCGATGNILRVTVRHDLPLDLARLARNFYSTSSCGVCGKASIDAVTASAGGRRVAGAESGGSLVVRESVLRRLPDTLRAAQAGFAETGGMHAVGLFTPDGELLASREDVGRHNAMDKLVGAALLTGELPWSERIVLLSGRASFELLQKAMMAGAPLVAAIGAPSTLAVELAESAGITLVAFLRPGGCNVYCHAWRVSGAIRGS